jgi:hypothetical protein
MAAEPDSAARAPGRLREAAIGLGLVVGGGALFAASSQLPPGTTSDPVGPRGFPTLLALGLVGSGLAVAAQSWLAGSAKRAAPATELTAEEDDEHGPLSPARLLGGILLTAAYVGTLQHVGFVVGTPLYLAALLWLQGGVPRRQFLATVLGYPLALYVLFALLLGVPVPGGVLERLLY